MKTNRKKLYVMIALLACLSVVLYNENCTAQDYWFDYPPASRPKDYHQLRRDKFLEQMEEGSIAVFAANKSKNGDGWADYKFKQDLNFYYLTGLENPDIICLLIPGSIDEFVKFVPPQQQLKGWPGAARIYGNLSYSSMGYTTPLNSKIVYSTEQMDKILPFDLRGKTKVYLSGPGYYDPEGKLNRKELQEKEEQLQQQLKQEITAAAQGALLEYANPDPMITDLRAIKDEFELNLLRRAIDITCQAHINVLEPAYPGMYEYEIQAIIEGTFFRNGLPRVGFTTICGSGPHTYELHYSRNTRQTEDGDMIVMDIGAEFGGYTADVTRSIPLNGKFTPEQRDIYEIVLKANQVTIAIVEPGLDYSEINATAQRVLAEGLLRLGFVDDVEKRWQVRMWTQHGVTHGIGLNVHESATRSDRYSSGRNRGPSLLEVNSIFTVEPGIYISEKALERKPREVSDEEWEEYLEKVTPLVEKYRYIGVRIEDDVLVTEDGYEVVSAKAPKTIADIESIMNKKR